MALKSLVRLAGCLVVMSLATIGRAQSSSGFSYQGVLKQSGEPVTGTVDATFRLFDAAVGGAQRGVDVVVPGIVVTDGLFEVALDFGFAALAGGDVFLEVEVTSPNSALLAPRQPIRSVPFASQAAGAIKEADGSVTFLRESTSGEALSSVDPNGRLFGTDVVARTPDSSSSSPLLSAEGPFPVLQMIDSDTGVAVFGVVVNNDDPASRLTWLQFATADGYTFTSDDGNGNSPTLLTLQPGFGRVGIGEVSSPLSKLHLRNLGAGPGLSTYLFQDDMIIEDSDAVLSLVSDAGGSFGSHLLFREIQPDGSGNPSTTWSIGRKVGTFNGRTLQFRFGESANYSQNDDGLISFNPTGSIGIGLEQPTAALHVQRAIANIVLEATSGRAEVEFVDGDGTRFEMRTGFGGLSIGAFGTGGSVPTAFEIQTFDSNRFGYVAVGPASASQRLTLPNVNGAGGRGLANAWNTYSSIRYKEDVRTLADPIERLQELRGVSFAWKEDHGEGRDIGFIAEEIAEVLPEVVSRDSDGVIMGFDYGRVVPLAVEAIKEQQGEIESLRDELAEVRGFNQALMDRLEKLEGRLGDRE